MKIGIIGAGIAGLATAIRLACRGFEVTVFEANGYAGGKLSQIEQDGFRFDAGPSLFTLPTLVDELLELADKNTTDYFAYTRLPMVCKYFYEDGTVIEGLSKPKDFCIEVYKKTGEHPQKVYEHLERSRQKYDLTKKIFLESSLHKMQTYLMPKTFNAISKLSQLDLTKTMNEANELQFTSPKVVQLFNRFATYNGSDPYQAPATLNIIPHLEHNIGAYFPIGGMYAITQTLLRVAKELGVVFHFNSRVQSIEVDGKKVLGLKVGEKRWKFDKVVSNMDVFYTYRKLLPNQKAPEKTLQQPKSSSALIFYWGIKQQFPQLDLHNIFFGKDYKAEFDHIFQQKTVYQDPTIYLNISSKYQPNDAPKGSENWFVMVNVPANEGQDWEQLIAVTRQNVLQKLSRMLKVNISKHIVTEAMLDPRSIEAKTASHQGALYGSNSNNKFAAFLRHPNFSSSIKGLYFCGGSVHPGGGIPLCLLSAKIVDGLIGDR
ncbi:MAG: 1-hydroxycarotenoid 3,4-desaturase CrtD [Chitinophagales bacterium]